MEKSIKTLLFIIVSISLTVALRVSLAFGFLPPIVYILYKAKNRKASLKLAVIHLYKCRTVFAIILLLGANIAIWMASGILPTIIYYGFNWIQDFNMLLVTFLTTVLVATVMGTGLGTFSTIGIVFIGLTGPLDYPPALVIGTIVSGAFVADKISPVAALVNLTLQMTKVDYKTYLREAAITLIPTLFITSVVYGVLNEQYVAPLHFDTAWYQEMILSVYHISPWLLLIPVLMFALALKGINTLISMMSVFILGGGAAVLYQGESLQSLFHHILWGYSLSTDQDFLNTTFKGGGMAPMFEVLIIVGLAVMMTGVLMENKVLEPILNRLFHHTKNASELIFKTALVSIFLTSLTCDQTVGITLPGELLHKDYKDKNLSRAVLARTISDSGTIVAPLEFWNVNALIITGLTGVSALAYAPYAVLCYVSPIVMLMHSKLILGKR